MGTDLKRLLLPALVAAATGLVLYLVRTAAFRLLRKWASRTETTLDDIILGSFRTPSLYWCLAIALYAGIAVSDLPDRYVHYLSKAIEVIVIFSAALAVANLASGVLNQYIQRSRLAIPATGLGVGIVRGSILLVGGLIILSAVGLSIAPIITALGVGGLAVALALQDTLANLFAGIYILAEKSVRMGDFVRLETGQEGYVEDITWRTTRIRMLPNNMVIVPNSKLAQSLLTNYDLPEKRMALLIPVEVSYDADPERVEKILLEEAGRAAGEVPGLLADPLPSVQLIPGFGQSGLDFTLVCHVARFVDQYLVQHELRKRILTRFREEGIEIPYPQRTVHVRDERGRSG